MRLLPSSLFTLIAVLICQIANGQVERSKTIEKSYDVNSNVEVAVISKYGDVEINTWDQNKLDVEITITVKKSSASKAEEYLDRISIDISESSNSYEFETEIDGNINMKSGEEFSIDYDIKMPRNAELYTKVSYGSLDIGELLGDAELKVAYGNMKAESLGGDTELKLSYGNGDIDEMKSGELSISYSNIKIGELSNADVMTQYSNVDLGDTKNITMSNKYGSFGVETVNSLDGSLKYGNLEIDKLYNSLILSITHGNGVKVDWISKDFEEIDIESDYASAVLYFERGFSADVQGYFKYCDLKFNDDFEFNYVNKSSSSAEYKGKIGSGSGNSKINLNSSYGNVKIGYSR